jgi:hypothetical protein
MFDVQSFHCSGQAKFQMRVLGSGVLASDFTPLFFDIASDLYLLISNL